MFVIIKTEFRKLKRYSILWAGVLLMLLSVLLTLFTSLAKDGSIWDFTYLYEQVIKNNMSEIFPMCITLITGFIINREYKDDTLKNIQTIPISLKKLIAGKLIVAAVLSVLFGVACFIFTIAANLIVKFPGLNISIAIQAFFQITFANLFLYIAVLPIIIATSRFPNGFLAGVIAAFIYGYLGLYASANKVMTYIYPIVASLGMVGYRAYDVHWNIPLCCLNMAVMLVISAVLLVRLTGDKTEVRKLHCKELKIGYKKGW